MLKIALVSGAPPQTPLGELTTVHQSPQSGGASCLRQSRLRAFGARNLTYSDIGTPPSRSQLFSSRLPLYSIPGSDPVHEVWTFLELTNYGYLCILCTHLIYVYRPSVIS